MTVDDVDQAEPQVLALGARRTDLQPGIDEDSNWQARLSRPRRPPPLPLLGLIGTDLEQGQGSRVGCCVGNEMRSARSHSAIGGRWVRAFGHAVFVAGRQHSSDREIDRYLAR